MDVPYARVYLARGYNVLMPDIRGHGESGGETNDWGIHDAEDMDSWVALLKQQDPQVSIGFHGISPGSGHESDLRRYSPGPGHEVLCG